jgi:ribosomal protein S18 acetylase RimI-like enzyme
MDVTVREATVDDHPGLCALWGEADLIHHEALPNVFASPLEPSRSLDYVKSILYDPSKKLLVADAQDGVAGFVTVTLRERNPPFVLMTFAVVEEVVVAEEYRGMGLGKRLMSEVEAWAKNQGAAEVWLDVWEFNESAIGFYASLGFETATLRLRKAIEPERP